MINKNIKGITLIEILIGVVISSIMMGAMLTSYKVVNGSYRQIIDKASIGNSSRALSEMLLRDIRMGGYKHFDDPLITFSDNGRVDIPIEINKSVNIIHALTPLILSNSPKTPALINISDVSSKEHFANGPISLLFIPCLSIDNKAPLLVIVSTNNDI